MIYRILNVVVWFFVVMFMLNSLPKYDHIPLIFIYFLFSILYLLQDLPVINFVWKCVKMFCVIVLVFFTLGYVKTEIKEWWNKD
jgi:hypothetical protein